MSEEVDKFIKKYRARIQESHRRYAVPKRISVASLSPTYEPFNLDFEYEPGVQIDMSKSDFATLVEMEEYFEKHLRDRDWGNFSGHAKSIVDQNEREVRIRNSNPAAKLAYEKYQTMLRLTDTKYNQ
jgi:hypothetical protein